jgi:hypothetical protein
MRSGFTPRQIGRLSYSEFSSEFSNATNEKRRLRAVSR